MFVLLAYVTNGTRMMPSPRSDHHSKNREMDKMQLAVSIHIRQVSVVEMSTCVYLCHRIELFM